MRRARASRRAAALALCALALGATAACARPRPPESPRYHATLRGDLTLELTDTRDGAILIARGGPPVWQPVEQSRPPCAPHVALVPRPDGFDLVFEFTNATTGRASLGRINIAPIAFGPRVFTRDFRYDGKEIALDHGGRAIAPGGWFYPDGWYSPVLTVREGQRTIGVALHYPVLEYKHQARLRLATTRGRHARDGLAWNAEIFLNPESPDRAKFNPDGDLAPGESRRYVVSVRIADDEARWIDTLAPYRDSFRERYGPVRYTRDPRPVNAVTAAVRGRQSPDNPYGFTRDNLRPDKHGWRPWADLLIARRESGWERIMVWSASGVATRGRDKAHTFRFVSAWFDGPRTSDAPEQFKRVADAGVDLGFWWGRSAQVVDDWTDEDAQDLDPDNPTHVARAFRELDLAVHAGARTIGVGAFRRMPLWRAVKWLETLQRRAPGVRFVTEPICGDVMHALTPAFLVATRSENNAALRLETPHALADLLNPGHETWGLIRRDRLESFLGRPATDADVAEEARRIAALGYVPVVGYNVEPGTAFDAAETWDID